MVQLLYNNLWFVENKRGKWNLEKDKAENVGTDFHYDLDFAIINVFYVLTLLSSIYTLLRGATTDPGIIPRHIPQEPENDIDSEMQKTVSQTE